MIFTDNKDNNIAYFNASLIKYTNLNTYIELFKTAAKLRSISTITDIQPDILGSNIESTLVKYGKPDFIFNDNKLMIYLYSRKLNELKIRYEIHFYSNKVFAAHYIYQKLAHDDKNYLINKLKDEYLAPDIDWADICKSKIIDKNHETVFLKEFLGGLQITYLSGKELDWFTGMTAEIKARREDKSVAIKSANSNIARFLARR